MFDNEQSWRTALNEMFAETQEAKVLDTQADRCTPTAILATMQSMGTTVHRLDHIVSEVRKRNSTATQDAILDGLRQLYRDKKISFSEVAGRQFFALL